MDAAWFTAAVPDPPPKILGLSLAPLTLGHELLLHRHGSAFARGGEVTLGEFLFAVLVCAEPLFTDAHKTIHDLHAADVALIEKFARDWSQQQRRSDLKAAVLAFQNYLKAGRWMPEVNIPQHPRELASPWPLRSLALVMKHFHFTYAQALDTPVSTANALLCAYFDTQGEIDLYTPSDDQLFNHLHALEARAAAGEKVWS